MCRLHRGPTARPHSVGERELSDPTLEDLEHDAVQLQEIQASLSDPQALVHCNAGPTLDSINEDTLYFSSRDPMDPLPEVLLGVHAFPFSRHSVQPLSCLFSGGGNHIALVQV